ncbi:transcriptional regulatory family protein [[Clostridium] bifermentans ATCC 638]|uniref:Stage 0 sporulation protein A homolog n=1 Tax=Paraclostridium bifermentans ATCC 638 = DSM 14991 TaxID=1233171 RepID=T4VRZ8_PARBF|nr:response regulator transcription factor [Paraclostridium bifermentans]EQK43467.1 transcriptional regulatory family protein [[Clostridium] bifermentans ATCC 638] [Paraclostridium bifermentans ATCC 638 = DSM 14991]RIZ58188.1 DNA-binding response regulator [Paraclostridium bifermentans]UAG17323.1 response regulator transcription factor [Paraclostridium bifermentans]
MKILVVEDNLSLLKSIKKELETHFQVECTGNGEDAYFLIKQNIYDLVVLDLMLPGMDGIQILEKIRKENEDVLVLILTAKESLDDKVKAFMLGANDYLTKPFYMEELVARIYAMLRTKGKIDSKNTLEFKGLKLDLNKKVVTIDDNEIEIPNKQFNLLEYLLLNKGTILLKEQIFDRIWGMESDSTIDIVEVYISNLRKKLSKYGYHKYIITKRRVGYMFDDK